MHGRRLERRTARRIFPRLLIMNADFLADPNFWEWIRTLGAALLGGILGGAFTLIAQIRSSKDQSRLEESRHQHEAEVRRGDRVQEEQDAKFLESRNKAFDLFEEYVSLHREFQDAAPSPGQIAGGRSYVPTFRTIWTGDRSLRIDVLRILVADKLTRDYLERLGILIDELPTLDPHSPYGYEWFSTYRVALSLSADAVFTMARYLRRESFAPEHEESIQRLEERLAASQAREAADLQVAYEATLEEQEQSTHEP